MAPTLFTSCKALPPEGALRLRPGKAGSAALAGEVENRTLFTSCKALPPEGALRLRPGKAGSAALAGEVANHGLVTLRNMSPPGGLRLRPGASSSSGQAKADSAFGTGMATRIALRRSGIERST